MLLMKDTVLRKATLHWFSYFQIVPKYKKNIIGLTNQLNVIFDGFCMITRIEFSCLYYELLFHKYFVAMKYR